eukprot:753634-Hanusia_phi.AAC.2
MLADLTAASEQRPDSQMFKVTENAAFLNSNPILLEYLAEVPGPPASRNLIVGVCRQRRMRRRERLCKRGKKMMGRRIGCCKRRRLFQTTSCSWTHPPPEQTALTIGVDSIAIKFRAAP